MCKYIVYIIYKYKRIYKYINEYVCICNNILRYIKMLKILKMLKMLKMRDRRGPPVLPKSLFEPRYRARIVQTAFLAFPLRPYYLVKVQNSSLLLAFTNSYSLVNSTEEKSNFTEKCSFLNLSS